MGKVLPTHSGAALLHPFDKRICRRYTVVIFFAKPFGVSGRNGLKEARGVWLPIPGGPLLNAHKHFMLPHKPRIYQENLLD
jgi:hypothetical protein